MQDKKACEGLNVPDDYYDAEVIDELEKKADLKGVDSDATKDEQVAYYTKLAQEHGEDSVDYCIQCVTTDADGTICGLNKAAKLVDAEDGEVDVNGTKFTYKLSAMIVEDAATADMAIKLFSATGAIALASGLQMLY